MMDPRLVSPAYEMQRFLEREARAVGGSRPPDPHPRWPERHAFDRQRPSRAIGARR